MPTAVKNWSEEGIPTKKDSGYSLIVDEVLTNSQKIMSSRNSIASFILQPEVEIGPISSMRSWKLLANDFLCKLQQVYNRRWCLVILAAGNFVRQSPIGVHGSSLMPLIGAQEMWLGQRQPPNLAGCPGPSPLFSLHPSLHATVKPQKRQWWHRKAFDSWCRAQTGTS